MQLDRHAPHWSPLGLKILQLLLQSKNSLALIYVFIWRLKQTPVILKNKYFWTLLTFSKFLLFVICSFCRWQKQDYFSAYITQCLFIVLFIYLLITNQCLLIVRDQQIDDRCMTYIFHFVMKVRLLITTQLGMVIDWWNNVIIAKYCQTCLYIGLSLIY